jgi:hypothetical protein
MPAHDAVEAALARLMPPALSQDSHLELEAMIDELSGAAGPVAFQAQAVARRPSGFSRSWFIGSGVAATAAALAGLCVVIPMNRLPELAAAVPSEVGSGWVLVSQSGTIESVTDEGWQESVDGAAMHAVRLNVVEENRVRDMETGMVVRISQPREEILLTPVSAF